MKNFLQFLRRAWKYFRGTKRVWRRPPQSDLLIIDRGTASPLDEMFAHHKPHIMDIRGESINMFALLRALPKARLGAVAYLEAYIDFVNPKLVLSRSDNNHTLWQLKRRPGVTYQVALVQNGWRLDYQYSLPPVDSAKSYEVDQYFSFGKATSELMTHRVKGKMVLSGSIRANRYLRVTNSNHDSPVMFISTFRAAKLDNYLDGAHFFYLLGQYCAENERALSIVGCERSNDGSKIEYDFYSRQLSNFVWSFRRRESDSGSYDSIHNSKCVLVESSSLGYECLGMGIKVGFIAFRPQHRQDRRFGKPLEFGEKGPFWTNDPSEGEIGRVLDYLLSVSDDQWERDSGWIRDQLIVHDYGNTKIRAYVEGVLTDSLENR